MSLYENERERQSERETERHNAFIDEYYVYDHSAMKRLYALVHIYLCDVAYKFLLSYLGLKHKSTFFFKDAFLPFSYFFGVRFAHRFCLCKT